MGAALGVAGALEGYRHWLVGALADGGLPTLTTIRGGRADQMRGSPPPQRHNRDMSGIRYGVAALCLVSVLASPAVAADYVTGAGAALRQDVMYVDPASAQALSRDERAEIRDRLLTATTPVFVAVLPAEAADQAPGGAGRVPYLIYQQADRPGTYAVIVGTSLHAGSTVIGPEAGRLASQTATNHGDPATALLAFVDDVEASTTGRLPDELANTETDEESEQQNGTAVPWLLIATVAVGGLAFVRARRAASVSRPAPPREP